MDVKSKGVPLDGLLWLLFIPVSTNIFTFRSVIVVMVSEWLSDIDLLHTALLQLNFTDIWSLNLYFSYYVSNETSDTDVGYCLNYLNMIIWGWV